MQKSEINIDKKNLFCYNSRCSSKIQSTSLLRICVMAARQTLTLFVWVQILDPQPKQNSTHAKGAVFVFTEAWNLSDENSDSRQPLL